MKEFKYTTCFAELEIKPLVSQDKDKYLALASLAEVGHLIPKVNPEINLDLLPIAFNACVVNRVNKNKDVIDTETAVAMHKWFINKPINLEHNKSRVIGFILTAGFSEFGTDRILTEEQVKIMTGPFNITLGGVVWRLVSPEISDYIEEASDPNSDKYLKISASWELGFTDYRVALLDGGAKNLSDAKIISDPAEVEAAKDSLTSFGGDGKYNDLFAYRMPSYGVLPLGIGFTQKPAAEVLGVATLSSMDINNSVPDTFGNEPKKGKIKSVPIPTPVKTEETINPPNKETFGEAGNKNIISQSEKNSVKKERYKNMKITSLTDITDENLKECSASTISDFISSELTKGSFEWEKEKNALNTQLAEAQENGKKLQEEQVKLQEQFKQVQATVEALQAEKLEREKIERFNARMSAVTEEFTLDDEASKAIAEEIKAIASDEEFSKWQAKAKVLLKGFMKKKAKCEDEEEMEEEDEAKCKGKAKGKKDEAKASEANASEIVSDAIDNGKQETSGVPNTSSASAQSLKEKYQAAFAKENFVITM